MDKLLNDVKKYLNIPEDSWIGYDGFLWQDQSYTSCGSGYNIRLRKATEVDKAVFLLETELKMKERVEREKQEKQTYLWLKKKFESES